MKSLLLNTLRWKLNPYQVVVNCDSFQFLRDGIKVENEQKISVLNKARPA